MRFVDRTLIALSLTLGDKFARRGSDGGMSAGSSCQFCMGSTVDENDSFNKVGGTRDKGESSGGKGERSKNKGRDLRDKECSKFDEEHLSRG